MQKWSLIPDEELMRNAWVQLKNRHIMFESVLLAAITMLDVWWTLYVVRNGFAIEANPLMDWALGHGNGAFVAVKMAYLLPALVVFEYVRGLNASFAKLAANMSVWGYIGLYAIATIALHGVRLT